MRKHYNRPLGFNACGVAFLVLTLASLTRIQAVGSNFQLLSDPEKKWIADEVSCTAFGDFSKLPVPDPAHAGVCTVRQAGSPAAVYDLGCGEDGFVGYFAPSNWTIEKENGDRGVDVTGAPNAESIFKDDSSRIEFVAEQQVIRLSIVLPTAGYVTFDWGSVGGSISEPGTVKAFVNNEPASSLGNTFYSPALEAGDVLALVLSKGAAIQRFRFLSNAKQVVVREWVVETETGAYPLIQYTTIKRASLTDVIFPGQQTLSVQTSAPLEKSITPQRLGFPTIDLDGDLETSEDQLSVGQMQCQFELNCEDKLWRDGDDLYLYRKWTVVDPCSNSYSQSTQVIKLYYVPESGDENYTPNASEEPEGYDRAAPMGMPSVDVPTWYARPVPPHLG